jgi:hypothetical protein
MYVCMYASSSAVFVGYVDSMIMYQAAVDATQAASIYWVCMYIYVCICMQVCVYHTVVDVN